MTSVATASLDYAGASQGPAAAFKQRRADLNALKTALQSGDLAGAQKAFAALQQDLQSTQGAAGQRGDASGQSSTLAKDLDALKTALQSGDLTGAQKAFASVQQDMRTGHAHRHSRPTDVTSTTAAPTSISVTTADSTVGITQALVASPGGASTSRLERGCQRQARGRAGQPRSSAIRARVSSTRHASSRSLLPPS